MLAINLIKPILIIIGYHLIKNSKFKVNFDVSLYEKYQFNIDFINNKINNIKINNENYNNIIDLFNNVKRKIKKTKKFNIENKKEINKINFNINYKINIDSKNTYYNFCNYLIYKK